MDFFPTLLNSFPCAHDEYRSSQARLRFVVRGPLIHKGGGPDPQPNKKGERLRGLLGSHACVLGLPCKVKKLDSNRPLLTAIETA